MFRMYENYVDLKEINDFLEKLKQLRDSLKLIDVQEDSTFEIFDNLKMPSIHLNLKNSKIYSLYAQQFIATLPNINL